MIAPEPKKVGLLPMLTLRVSILVGLSKITFFSPELVNASDSILVTLTGIVTEVNFDAYWNAPKPMLVTLAGIVTEVKLCAP